ncbi:MAG TPA: CerR family C-terminal domain-containing protein [Sphingobium sp.]
MSYSRLVETATEHFGRKGYEGASTREIAAASGTAMSSITYHFGGKEGLYLAVADHIAAQIAERQAPSLDTVWESATATRTQATEALLGMLEAFARTMLTPESAAWSSFIVREQQEPTAAFERLYEGAMRDMVEMFVALIAIARPDLDDANARMTGIFLYGQALILRVGHASVCRTLGTESLTAGMQSALLARLRINTLSVLSEKPG